jgi:hypothetical protein
MSSGFGDKIGVRETKVGHLALKAITVATLPVSGVLLSVSSGLGVMGNGGLKTNAILTSLLSLIVGRCLASEPAVRAKGTRVLTVETERADAVERGVASLLLVEATDLLGADLGLATVLPR